MGKKEKQQAQKLKVDVPIVPSEVAKKETAPEAITDTSVKVEEAVQIALSKPTNPPPSNVVMVDGNIAFYVGSSEVLKFCPNGKAYVRGELMERNQALYEQVKLFFREMLRQ